MPRCPPPVAGFRVLPVCCCCVPPRSATVVPRAVGVPRTCAKMGMVKMTMGGAGLAQAAWLLVMASVACDHGRPRTSSAPTPSLPPSLPRYPCPCCCCSRANFIVKMPTPHHSAAWIASCAVGDSRVWVSKAGPLGCQDWSLAPLLNNSRCSRSTLPAVLGGDGFRVPGYGVNIISVLDDEL